jgi:hypothetical protein
MATQKNTENTATENVGWLRETRKFILFKRFYTMKPIWILTALSSTKKDKTNVKYNDFKI